MLEIESIVEFVELIVINCQQWPVQSGTRQFGILSADWQWHLAICHGEKVGGLALGRLALSANWSNLTDPNSVSECDSVTVSECDFYWIF